MAGQLDWRRHTLEKDGGRENEEGGVEGQEGDWAGHYDVGDDDTNKHNGDAEKHNDDHDHAEKYFWLQLKREKGVEREKMSVTCKDLVDFVKQQMAVSIMTDEDTWWNMMMI